MPSTLVHIAIGALIAAALLEEAFDARTLGVVLAASALPDLDTFLDLSFPGTHRAALHTIVLVVLAGILLAYDLEREESWLRARGRSAPRVAWVSVLAFALAGIGPDLFTNGVNLFYPLHDQFYALQGNVFLSNQRGFVQTLWELEESARGTTETRHYSTGVNPNRGTEPADVERIFPIAQSGLQVLLLLSATIVTAGKLRLSDRAERA